MDRGAAAEAFADYLDGTRYTVDQIGVVDLIIDELSHNGVVDPGRLFESPYTDRAPTGPGHYFPEAALDGIVGILDGIKHRAVPDAAAS